MNVCMYVYIVCIYIIYIVYHTHTHSLTHSLTLSLTHTYIYTFHVLKALQKCLEPKPQKTEFLNVCVAGVFVCGGAPLVKPIIFIFLYF